MQQLELFECLHDSPQLGGTAVRILLHALAGRFPRDGLFDYWRGCPLELNRLDQVLELVTLEGRDANFLGEVEGGHRCEGQPLAGLPVLLVAVFFFLEHTNSYYIKSILSAIITIHQQWPRKKAALVAVSSVRRVRDIIIRYLINQ